MHFLADVYVQCEVCRGAALHRETLEITYKGKNIADVLDMTVDEAARFFRNVPQISDKLLALEDWGSATSASGNPPRPERGRGTADQLAAELAKKATGRTVYILTSRRPDCITPISKAARSADEAARSRNTLVVIEHNLEVIKARWIIDLGPRAERVAGGSLRKGRRKEGRAS